MKPHLVGFTVFNRYCTLLTEKLSECQVSTDDLIKVCCFHREQRPKNAAFSRNIWTLFFFAEVVCGVD